MKRYLILLTFLLMIGFSSAAVWTDEYQIRIYADSVPSVSGATVTNEGGGIFKVNTTNPNYELSRAIIMKGLFYGTTGSNPNIVNAANITKMVSVDERDHNRFAIYGRRSVAGDFSYTFTFDSTTNNENVSSWSYLKHFGSAGPPGSELRFQLGGSTNHLLFQPGLDAESDETGTDTSAEQRDNPSTAVISGSNLGGSTNEIRM